MIRITAPDRHFRTELEWLSSVHHFNFGGHQDPDRAGFGPLVVWNDDRIAPGTGFPLHPHRDMEIITYVRRGAITHRDSLDNHGRTAAGDVQVMSAGTGIRHSERNEEAEPTELFQIWLLPDRRGLRPRWQRHAFPAGDRDARLVPLASGRDGVPAPMTVHQDASLHAASLAPGQIATFAFGPGRGAYLVPAGGRVRVNGETAPAGAGVAISGETNLRLEALDPAEIVMVDVALGR